MDKSTFAKSVSDAINTIESISLKTFYKISRDILAEIMSDIQLIRRRAEECEITDVTTLIRSIVKRSSAYANFELSIDMDIYLGEISENIKTLESVIHGVINDASLFIKNNCIKREKEREFIPPLPTRRV
jgi:hypothetical protein